MVVHPKKVWLERLSVTPFSDEVEDAYNLVAERIRHPHYQTDLLLASQSRTANRL